MFYSILYPFKEQHGQSRQTEAPPYFKDLHLGQIFEPILRAKKEFELEGFFYTALNDNESIVYRQDVMRELEDTSKRVRFAEFSKTVYDLSRYMAGVRKNLLSEDSYASENLLTKGHMLDYAKRYCHAVSTLAKGLTSETMSSAGLRGFSSYLSDYCSSKSFTGLCGCVSKLREAFSDLQYCMLIKSGNIRVRKYEGQADHSVQILACFDKFRQGKVKDYRQEVSEEPYAAHIETAVLRMLSGLYKEEFNALNTFCAEYLNFDDDTIVRFSREIQFYLSWLDFVIPLRQSGLMFCYPKMSENHDDLYDYDGFDLALARMRRSEIVANDFRLNSPERAIVVTGPNQGGKTTYARAFGQIHYLASLGLCVPGREAALYLFDNIFTHFSREEDLSTLSGKLQDDLVRLHALLNKATSRSVIIINEIFASTTLNDALLLGQRMMDTLSELGAPVLIVTFLDELASHGPETVSMMSLVKDGNPADRTYKIIRKPADGLAYAIHIAGKYGLTYEQLSGRLRK